MNPLNDIVYVRPEDAIPFEPAEFAFSLESCGEMAREPGLLNRPEEHFVGIIGEDGKTTRYCFSDHPDNRFGLAVLQRYQNNRRKYFSFMWRWFALAELIQSGVLDGRYYRRCGDDCEIADEVLELAASFPVIREGRFARHAFMAALEAKSKSDEPTV
jgi:hypothetical protein